MVSFRKGWLRRQWGWWSHRWEGDVTNCFRAGRCGRGGDRRRAGRRMARQDERTGRHRPAGQAQSAGGRLRTGPVAAAAPAPLSTLRLGRRPPTSRRRRSRRPPPRRGSRHARRRFDVARIGPDGRAVIAGRAAPSAKIVLLDGGKEIATAEADARGEWVIIVQDPPLAAGPARTARRAAHRGQGAGDLGAGRWSPSCRSRPRQNAPAPAARGDAGHDFAADRRRDARAAAHRRPACRRSADLSVSTLDYDERGHVTVSGQAAPGAVVRAYVERQDGGRRQGWPPTVAGGSTPAESDRTGQASCSGSTASAPDGKPVARLELPFERVIVAPVSGTDGRRLHIVKGDNLWNIARAHYGAGLAPHRHLRRQQGSDQQSRI